MKSKLIRQLHACLAARNMADKESKEHFVHSFTDGRCTSSKEMTELELELAIHRLNGDKQVQTGTNDDTYKMRRKLISLFREMGCNVNGEEKKTLVADMATINQKLTGKWGKGINQYSKDELSKIIAVVQREWVPAYYKSKKRRHA